MGDSHRVVEKLFKVFRDIVSTQERMYNCHQTYLWTEEFGMHGQGRQLVSVVRNGLNGTVEAA